MSNTNIAPLLLSSLIVSFVCYKCFSKDTVEHWWDLSVPLTTETEVIGPDGVAVSGNNQQQLTYSTNPIINTSFMGKREIQDSFREYKEAQEQAQEGYCSSCNDKSEEGTGFYTVPGNYQPYLSPRMNSAGLNSYVRYNLPDEKYQANKPNDPFTIAEYFDKPQQKKENFQNVSSKVVESSKVKGNELPTTGDMKNVGAASDVKDGFYVNTERLIFSTAKNRLRGQGDPIRGDLPVIPCNPEANPNSNVWFRPSANPQSMLNGGAMNVLGGTGNTTAMQLAELMSTAGGGQNTTYGGVPYAPPSNSIVGQAVAASQKAMNIGSQTTQSAQVANGSNPTVVASTLP